MLPTSSLPLAPTTPTPLRIRARRWLRTLVMRHWPPARTCLLLTLLAQHGEQTPRQLARNSHGIFTEAMTRRHLRPLLRRGLIEYATYGLGDLHYTLTPSGISHHNTLAAS